MRYAHCPLLCSIVPVPVSDKAYMTRKRTTLTPLFNWLFCVFLLSALPIGIAYSATLLPLEPVVLPGSTKAEVVVEAAGRTVSLRVKDGSYTVVRYAVYQAPEIHARFLGLALGGTSILFQPDRYQPMAQCVDGGWWVSDGDGVYVGRDERIQSSEPYYVNISLLEGSPYESIEYDPNAGRDGIIRLKSVFAASEDSLQTFRDIFFPDPVLVFSVFIVSGVCWCRRQTRLRRERRGLQFKRY